MVQRGDLQKQEGRRFHDDVLSVSEESVIFLPGATAQGHDVNNQCVCVREGHVMCILRIYVGGDVCVRVCVQH